MIWPHYYLFLVSVEKKVLELQGVKVPPHCTQFIIIVIERLNLSFCFIFTQEISHTYFRTCLKDHAGIDGQRDNLEVHFAVIGGNECNGDDFSFSWILLFLSLQVSFCSVVEHWNTEIGGDVLTRKVMIVLVNQLETHEGTTDFNTAWSHV